MGAAVHKVAVLGGGVAGLAVAARLQADGLQVEVFERRAKGSRVGHGLILTVDPKDPLRDISAGTAAGSCGTNLEVYELRSNAGDLISEQPPIGIEVRFVAQVAPLAALLFQCTSLLPLVVEQGRRFTGPGLH